VNSSHNRLCKSILSVHYFCHVHIFYGTANYADDDVMEGSVHTVKENAEALVVVSKETGLEVNADKTKYTFMSQDHNAGRSHSMKTDNSSFQRAEKFKYLGTTLTYQNSIQDEIKSILTSGNVGYHSEQNLLSSSLLSKY